MNEYKKNRSNNVLKKLKESSELKKVEVDVVTNFSKMKEKTFVILQFILMIALKKIGSLGLDKMRVTSNKILIVWNAPLLGHKKPI